VLAVWRKAGSVPGATYSEEALAQLLEASPDGLLVAELDGELVGTLIAAWDGWRGNLYRLAVGRLVKTLLAALAVIVVAGCGSSQPKKDTDPSLGGTTTPTSKETTPTETTPQPAGAPRPPIQQRRIPFGAKRKQETAAYAERHYGTASSRLDAKVIVEHVTVTPTFQAVYDTFSSDQPDVELHELPNVCSHFVVDRDGTIYQLVSLELICRHTVGLNDHAIGIEHVGATDADVLGNSAQMDASLHLTRWLRCRYGISMSNVIGHNESLSSPYHHERVASLRNQTHSDWTKPDMDVYRAKLRSCAARSSG
jgi:beta-N-acetylhexosaminidase